MTFDNPQIEFGGKHYNMHFKQLKYKVSFSDGFYGQKYINFLFGQCVLVCKIRYFQGGKELLIQCFQVQL